VGEDTLRALDHPDTRAAVSAERALLLSLGGGCQTPIGAYARVEGERLYLLGIVLSADGADSVRDSSEGPASEAQRIGQELGAKLRGQGADGILDRSHLS
jgi:hydroxymethylbilane synthase